MSEQGRIGLWNDARHVLCVRLDAMGDVLMINRCPPTAAIFLLLL